MTISQAKLRTKTGCLTCRKRKVKCREEKPDCNNCLANGCVCAWPASDQLVDRRWRAQSRRRVSQSARQYGSQEVVMIARAMTSRPTTMGSRPQSLGLNLSDPWAEVKVDLICYFGSIQFPAFLLPGVSTDFFDECKRQYLDMANRSNGVNKSIIACCAANKSVLTQDTRFAQLGLKYYTDAIASINSALKEIGMGIREPDECLLVAIIFSYLYELWGSSDASHAADHVNGAIKLFQMRHGSYGTRQLSSAKGSPPLVKTPIERLIAESILYQSLMLSFRNPFNATYRINTDFLLWTERLLQNWWANNTFPEQRTAVLGLPPHLYHIVLETIDIYNSTNCNKFELARLRQEIRSWEDYAFQLSATPSSLQASDEHVVLFILATSVLLDWVSEVSSTSSKAPKTTMFYISETPRWQVDKALLVLRTHLDNETWSLCFLGSWPMLILGYAVHTPHDIHTIKEALTRIWRTTGYGEIKRISEELHQVWSERENQMRHHTRV